MTDSGYNHFIKFLLWTAGIILLLYLFYLLTEILVIVALSVLLAFIFAPFVSLLEGRGFNRLTATLLIFAVF